MKKAEGFETAIIDGINMYIREALEPEGFITSRRIDADTRQNLLQMKYKIARELASKWATVDFGLESLSRDLVGKLWFASSEMRRAASLAACEYAIAKTYAEHPDVDKGLEELRAGRLLTAQTKAAIDALRAVLDEKTKTSNTGESQRMFAKARAVAAVSCASNENSFDAATEAIYEAAETIRHDDKRELFALIESILQ